MCLRWSNKDPYEGPFASVRLLTLDHQKTPLINFNSLTGLSHELVDRSCRPALIYFVFQIKSSTCHRYISLMLSFHFFAQRERSLLVPCNYPNTPTHNQQHQSPLRGFPLVLPVKSPEAATNQCHADMPTCQWQPLCRWQTGGRGGVDAGGKVK